VPALRHDAHSQEAVSVRISIVIPAHNEAEILTNTTAAIVEGLRARGVDFELWIMENGSTDTTLEFAEKLAATYDEVRVRARAAADYGKALRAGFLEATGDVVGELPIRVGVTNGMVIVRDEPSATRMAARPWRLLFCGRTRRW